MRDHALVSEAVGAALEAMGVECHLAGDYAGATEAFQRAHTAYRRGGDLAAAARTARTIGWFRGWVFGDWAVYRGWTARANRLLEEAGPDGAHRGWLILDRARNGADLVAQAQLYEAAIAEAQVHGDRDLECEARASLGLMYVFSGLVDEGMVRLDEALAALCAGDVAELPVLEGCLCGLLNACERTHDVRRAEEWLRAADELIARRNLVSVAGYCRSHYAGILIGAGRWPEAEAELKTVMVSLPVGTDVYVGAACRLAGLRVRQGRLEDAADLLDGIDHEDAVLPRAAMLLVRGGAEAAAELLEVALSGASGEPHVRAPLLARLVDARLAASDHAAAAAAAEDLAELVRDGSSPYLLALSCVAEARLCSDPADDAGLTAIRQAMTMLSAADLPYELALARLELAKALAPRRQQAAIAAATEARATFSRLGASPDVDASSALLRSWGAPTRTGARGNTDLTEREQEVLGLLSHGLSNAEISDRLFISAKTVEHHVGRVLAKLGVRSRTEAALLAVRRSN